MYAIIATGGKQYKVSEGDVIKVEKIDAEAGNTVTFDQVIAVSDNTLKVGADVANATVTATVMEQGRGKKVIVYKYKRKPVTTRRMVIDKHTLRLRSKRLTRNRYDNYYHS